MLLSGRLDTTSTSAIHFAARSTIKSIVSGTSIIVAINLWLMAATFSHRVVVFVEVPLRSIHRRARARRTALDARRRRSRLELRLDLGLRAVVHERLHGLRGRRCVLGGHRHVE